MAEHTPPVPSAGFCLAGYPIPRGADCPTCGATSSELCRRWNYEANEPKALSLAQPEGK